MPKYVLDRLSENVKINSDKLKSFFESIIHTTEDLKKQEELLKLYKPNFQTSKPGDVSNLINLLSLKEVEKLKKILNIESLSERKYRQELVKQEWEEIKDIKDLFLKYVLENSYLYIESIANYIAGMTDNFAKQEFEELY